MLTRLYNSPAGTLFLAAEDSALIMCDWTVNSRYEALRTKLAEEYHTFNDWQTLNAAEIQLDEYFAGQRREFTITVAPYGTDFQRMVWNALLKVPYGTTLTYGELAALAGKPRAVRAVASAVAANPLSVIIPCHRIVPAAGGVGQYAGGADAKRLLLDHEHADYHSNQ